MKKIQLFAALLFSLTAVANAQLEGFGYDGDNQELVARVGLGGYSHLEVGAGLFFNGEGSGDSKFNITASGRYLLALHSWEKLTGFLNVGGYFRDDNNGAAPGGNPNRGSFSVKAGYQPELLLVPHLAVSIMFGAGMTLVPDFSFSTMGEKISIVEGLNFRILF